MHYSQFSSEEILVAGSQSENMFSCKDLQCYKIRFVKCWKTI